MLRFSKHSEPFFSSLLLVQTDLSESLPVYTSLLKEKSMRDRAIPDFLLRNS